MKTFCVLPWIHLASHPDGNISLCCNSDHTDLMSFAKNFVDDSFVLLNLSYNTFNEIVNNDYFKKVRLQMLNGKIPRACERCFNEESKGLTSKRKKSQEEFKEFDFKTASDLTLEDGTIKPNLKFVELRLGNICNLKCRTCNPNSSKLWKSDYTTLEKHLPFVTKYDINYMNYEWISSDFFWDQLSGQFENLEQIYINGGEPTLVKKHWDFLKKLIRYRDDIKLFYNINTTYVSNNAIDIWKKFKNIELTCSIDDIEHRNEYIRYPSNWDEISENLSKLINSGFQIVIGQTISFMNYLYIPEFKDWVNEKGLGLHHNFVYDPIFLSPSVLPVNVRDLIHRKFEKSNLNDYEKNRLINSFSSGNEPLLLQYALEYTKLLDKLRNQSFEKSFPELSTMLNLEK